MDCRLDFAEVPDGTQHVNRLALGTAQFGLNYGIANRQGQVGLVECRAILDLARENGIDLLDTAIAYGQSEASLGSVGVNGWRVVTKLPSHPEACTDVAAWVREQVNASAARLGVSRLYGLLLHRPAQLLRESGQVLYAALCRLKSENVVEKIGISIYSADELEKLCANYVFDLIQAPFNVLDRRLINTGWLARLHSQGVEIHVRSIFLQGLLLMPPETRPQAFARWQPIWQNWDSWLEEHQLTPLQACLHYALSFSEIAQVVVGVDSSTQLKQIIKDAGGCFPPLPEAFRTNDTDLLDPARWAAT